jgi:hypothetical protein
MFHANRPLCVEVFIINSSVKTTKTGTWTRAGSGSNGAGLGVVDSSALFGYGCDSPANNARYQSDGCTANGSSGIAGVRGGWVLMIHFMTCGAFSGSSSALGAGWMTANGGTLLDDVGTIQAGSTTKHSCAYAVDLIDVTGPGVYDAAFLLADPNAVNNNIIANTTPNTTGETPRFMQLWSGVDNGRGTTIASLPGTIATFTGSTVITAASLNSWITQALNILNYPPMLNCQQKLSTGVAITTSPSTAPFNITPLLDSYSAFNVATSTYTVKIPGVYFCHTTIIIPAAFTSGSAQAGFIVNSTNFYGGNYKAVSVTGTNTAVSITRMLDLNAGDTVKVFAQASSSTNFGNGQNSHFIMVWMNTTASGGGLTYTPPDVNGFLMQAGYPPGTATGQLVPLFNAKIANDLNFLMNKPYLLATQTSAQTSITAGTWTKITFGSVAGPVHASNGDNYSGWSAANNWYVAPVAGWYMIMADVSVASSNGSSFQVGINVPTSGGIAAPTSGGAPPDYYQNLVTVSSGNASSATAIGCYYLLQGETAYIMANYETTGTWGTSVTNFNSSLSIMWVCE